MPPENTLAIPSLVLSLVVLATAGGLAVFQWLDQGRRDEDDLDDEEFEYYRRRDIRRRRGVILMALIGLASSSGFWINPRVGRDEARIVFGAWTIIGVLLIVVLGLAIADWLATVAHGAKLRRRLAQERQQFLDAVRVSLHRAEDSVSPKAPDDSHGEPLA